MGGDEAIVAGVLLGLLMMLVDLVFTKDSASMGPAICDIVVGIAVLLALVLLAGDLPSILLRIERLRRKPFYKEACCCSSMLAYSTSSVSCKIDGLLADA